MIATKQQDQQVYAQQKYLVQHHLKQLSKATLLSHKAGQHAPGNLNIIVGHRRFLSVIDGRDNRQSYRDQAAMADQKTFLNLQHFMDFIHDNCSMAQSDAGWSRSHPLHLLLQLGVSVTILFAVWFGVRTAPLHACVGLEVESPAFPRASKKGSPLPIRHKHAAMPTRNQTDYEEKRDPDER